MVIVAAMLTALQVIAVMVGCVIVFGLVLAALWVLILLIVALIMRYTH